MSKSKRWVMVKIPDQKAGPFRFGLDRMMYGDGFVYREAPRGIGAEVRGATMQEVGMFGSRALLSPPRTP